jgi:cytochrome c-type biogenesis protein
MLPLTAGYLASLKGAPSRSASIAAYCSGCALSLSATGLAFASAGSVYGSGSALPLARSFAGSVASISGLHLLQIPPIPSLTARASRFLPPLNADGVPSPSSSSSWLLKALAAGSVASFSASPCSTPLLASLLAFVASSAEPFRGALLMLCYGFGFVLPLAALASLTNASSHLLPLKPLTKNIAPIAGCLLLAGGSYTLSESALTLLLPSS